MLPASVSRVQASGGTIVETPIDLGSAAGLQTTITATDSTCTNGVQGIVAFVRGSQSMCFADITVVP